MTHTNTDTTGDPIGWFEIGTDDPAAARAFYGDLFRWAFSDDEPGYSMVVTGHPLMGGIRHTDTPQPPGMRRTLAAFCVQVADVPATVRRAEELGGKVQSPPVEAPNGLVSAYILDPAGNMVGVFSPPPAAG